MAYLIFVFGFVLSLAGGCAIFFGYAIVDIERGWTAVISGSVLLSGGMVVMSLAIVAANLNQLNLQLKTWKQGGTGSGDASSVPVSTGPIPAKAGHQQAAFNPPVLRGSPPRSDWRASNENPQESTDHSLGPLRETALEPGLDNLPPGRGPVPEPVRDVKAASTEQAISPVVRSPGESKFMPPHWGAKKPQALPPDSPETSRGEGPKETLGLRQSLEVPREVHDAQEVKPVRALETARLEESRDDPLIPEPAEKPVTGRYEADGVVYTLFEDGSIEARSATEVFHYATMEALKASFTAKELED